MKKNDIYLIFCFNKQQQYTQNKVKKNNISINLTVNKQSYVSINNNSTSKRLHEKQKLHFEYLTGNLFKKIQE